MDGPSSRLAGASAVRPGRDRAGLPRRACVRRRDQRPQDRAGRAALPAGLDERWWATVAGLRCFHGVVTLTALALHLELGGDWQRFARAPQLAAWLGLTPTLSQSGESSRQGAITKTGSVLARRLLVEAARHYAREPRQGVALTARQGRITRPRARNRPPGMAAPAPHPPQDEVYLTQSHASGCRLARIGLACGGWLWCCSQRWYPMRVRLARGRAGGGSGSFASPVCQGRRCAARCAGP